MKKIVIASDHAGFKLKQHLVNYLKSSPQVEDVLDLGADNEDFSVDYPDFADLVSKYVLNNPEFLGILVCGTGIGMSIAANKHKGIYAAHVSDPYSAEMAKKHNNANILCVGGRVLDYETGTNIIDKWLYAEYEDRHQKRVDKIKLMEDSFGKL